MRTIIIILTLLFFFTLSEVASDESLKCENEGCYEVIKTFAKLLEEKINETDKILAEAQKEINDVSFGNDEDFQKKINEIDHKLTMLIIDLNTGIDSGKYTLFELINTVFKAVNDAEINLNQLELSIENGNKLTKIAELEYTEVNDVIRKVREEFGKLENETEIDAPKALQDAFDKSEKFTSDTEELKEILDKMKIALRDYENNLLNARDLTLQAIEKFTETSKQIDEAVEMEKEISDLLEEAAKMSWPNHEIANMKKLSNDAHNEARTVFDLSLELLNEVSLLELNSKLDDIKAYVIKLDSHSAETENDLKKFADDNEKFLSEMEETIDMADEIKQRALKQLDELQDVIDEMKKLENTATKAIGDKDEIINSAQNIYKTLEDFTMKVEETHEYARRALEKIPEIHKKITESEEIVAKLENKADGNEFIAKNAKKKCTNAKSKMDAVLKESEGVQKSIEKVADDIDSMFENMETVNSDSEKNSNEIDQLKKNEGETEELIDTAKEKVIKTRVRAKEVDENVTKALDDIQNLVKQIEDFKSIDEKTLNEFEKKLEQLEDKELMEKIEALKIQKQEQEELVSKYKMEIASLEQQVRTIKENIDSLEEKKCFKRTRLEP